MPNNWILCSGAGINLLILSIPLAVQGLPISLYITSPSVWLYYGLISVFYFSESKASFYVKDEILKPPIKYFLPYISGILMLIVFWVSLYNHTHSSLLQSIISSIVIISGISIRVLSINTLHEFFISHIQLKHNHKLITSGVYAHIRHPSELGLLLICFGVPMLLSSKAGLLVTIVFIFPLSVYRILLEDKIIFLKFEKEFLSYRLSVPALLPKFIK